MELLNNLGINGKLLLAQIVNFLVLLFVLYKFAYGPVLKLLNERTEKIEKGLKDSEDAQKKLAEITEKEKKVLQEAGNRSREIFVQAESMAKFSADKIIAEAKEQSEKIIKNAEHEIEKNRKKMIQEVRQELGELVSMFSEKVARVSLDKKQHRELIDKAIDDFEKEKIEA